MDKKRDETEEQIKNYMTSEGNSPLQIEQFLTQRKHLKNQGGSYIYDKDISSLKKVLKHSELQESTGPLASKCAFIKLNGGLGTSMGLTGPKSEVCIRDGLNFIDICLRQSRLTKCPLVLMNSQNTQSKTRQLVEKSVEKPEIKPIDFMQSMVPKLNRETLGLASGPESLLKNPPGHGEVYDALFESGLLETLIKSGMEWAFISNIDNLGACIDEKILQHIADNNIPFLMEVTKRLESDKKGGHLALAGKQLILRETAQCAPEDKATFEDISIHQFFNTNNIWVNLDYLYERYRNDDPIKMSPITNFKTLDPRDPNSIPVVQLERAMGAAIEDIKRSQVVEVDRQRFTKVKNTADLLLCRSDLYTLNPAGQLVLSGEQRSENLPTIDLDQRYFKNIDEFEKRVPKKIPTFKNLQKLSIRGDHCLSSDTDLSGSIHIGD